ncbi:ribonuclease BN (tRNA processing enzyme) [Kibdelosporangium banguiense]|uniref:Ribonuclease BN (tRNA processing enzyme) n=1 Tax=Kibdelosporangium banguiense TaxID=1365924 RepID=A0ABS4TE22_9PSEU|nr:MBL fold metallo-hydrolase [Kibdelosporangium banguiense]MBP2322662.1 ribonuclease BN (tRNA processing enzyme) [Kibdelosporangium banguiense]
MNAINSDAVMTITVLGCGSVYPRPGQPCSGYLLRACGNAVWVDAGAGTFAELQRHAYLRNITTIWISHLHPARWADLLVAWSAYVHTPSLPRPLVLGPPGWHRRLDGMLGRSGATEEAFTIGKLHHGLSRRVGQLELQAHKLPHRTPTFGLRAQQDKRAFAYSADSGPSERLVELARNVNLLLIEAGASTSQDYHCTPEDAADTATKAQAERVLLTRLTTDLKPAEALARCQARFAGNIELARVGRIATA